MMKVDLGRVKASIAYSVTAEGSVLAQTVRARADKIAIHYDVESADAPERVAGLMRNARNGCFARQSIGQPGPLRGHGHPKRPALRHGRLPRAVRRVSADAGTERRGERNAHRPRNVRGHHGGGAAVPRAGRTDTEPHCSCARSSPVTWSAPRRRRCSRPSPRLPVRRATWPSSISPARWTASRVPSRSSTAG